MTAQITKKNYFQNLLDLLLIFCENVCMNAWITQFSRYPVYFQKKKSNFPYSSRRKPI